MLRKSTLLAVAASAALGLALLSPTLASAKNHGGGHGGGGHKMHGGGHGGGKMHGYHGGGRHAGHHRHRHRHWHVRYHRPVWYGVRPVYTSYSTPRVAGPCTCLTKQYTPDGRVLFKDICTNEAAINPPIVGSQQTGSIDAPVQQAANSALYQATPPNALPQVDPTTGMPK